MKPWKNKLVSGMLAASVACASAGCATGARTITHPTRGTVEGHVRPGDRVELVMKSGEKRKVEVAGIRPEALWVGCDGKVAYGEIQEVRVPGKRWSAGMNSGFSGGGFNLNGNGFNMNGCDGQAALVVVAVVVVVVVVAWGVSELNKASRRW